MKNPLSFSLFSGKLYLTTVRKLRVLGILLGLLSMSAVLISLLPYLTATDGGQYDLHSIHFAPYLPIIGLLAPIALTFQAFFFQYRRPGSDLFHSLPYTRRCLGITVTAAVLTWLYAMFALTLAICAVAISLSGAQYLYATLGWMFLFYAAVVTLVTACALIGVSASGTPVVGLLVTGLALFLPRAMCTVYRSILVYASGLMVYADAGAFLSPAMHLPTASLFIFLRYPDLPRLLGKSLPELYSYMPGILYTCAVSIVMFALGLWRFGRRPSELTGRDFQRPISRYLFRWALVLLPLLLLAFSLARYPAAALAASAPLPPLIPVGLAACMALYLLFDRLHTKSWHSLRFNLPLLLIAPLLVYGMFDAGQRLGRQTRTQLPKANDIASVRFTGQAGTYTPISGLSYGSDMQSQCTEAILHTKPEIRQFAARALADASAALDLTDQSALTTLTQLSMEIRLVDGRTLQRTVHINEMQETLLAQMLFSTPEYVAALRQASKGATLSFHGYDEYTFSPETTEAIRAVFRDEVASLSTLDFARIAYGYHLPISIQGPDYDALHGRIVLEESVFKNIQPLSRGYHIGQYTPRTEDAVLQAISKIQGDAIYDLLEDISAVSTRADMHELTYTLLFYYPVRKSGYSLHQQASLYAAIPWDIRYSGASPYEDPPDRATYEADRLMREEKIQAILRRSALAKHGGDSLLWAELSLWESPGTVTASRSASAFLTVSPEDLAELTRLALDERWR